MCLKRSVEARHSCNDIVDVVRQDKRKIVILLG